MHDRLWGFGLAALAATAVAAFFGFPFIPIETNGFSWRGLYFAALGLSLAGILFLGYSSLQARRVVKRTWETDQSQVRACLDVTKAFVTIRYDLSHQMWVWETDIEVGNVGQSSAWMVTARFLRGFDVAHRLACAPVSVPSGGHDTLKIFGQTKASDLFFVDRFTGDYEFKSGIAVSFQHVMMSTADVDLVIFSLTAKTALLRDKQFPLQVTKVSHAYDMSNGNDSLDLFESGKAKQR